MNASETEYKMNPQNCAKHDRGTCTCAFLYIAPHFNSRKLFHLIQKGIVAIMGLKTAQTNPWIADGWFKEFRRGFNLWGEVKEETIEFRKLLGFLVGDWTLGLAADCHLGRAGISSGYPQGCDHESLVTKHISSHWCTPGNIALSFCRCDSSPQWAHQFLLLGWETLLIILLVLSVQGTPTYPPHRFHHWHFAESASSQTFPSLLSIHSFYFLVYFKVSCRHQHTALPKHFNNLCLDLFLKLSFLVLLFKPMPKEVSEGGMRNEDRPSFLVVLPKAKASPGASFGRECCDSPSHLLLVHLWA